MMASKASVATRTAAICAKRVMAILVLSFLYGTAQAQPQRIENIFDAPVLNGKTDAGERFNGCPRPPAAVMDHRSIVIYADAASRTISGEQWVRQSAGTRGIREFSASVARMADGSYLAADKRDARAACAARWLEAWARGRAFLGEVTPQARYDTIWFGHVSLGVSYLKIKNSRSVSAAQHEAISAWLLDVARAAIRDEAALVAAGGQREVYRAWTSAAAAVAGVAANDRSLFDYGIANARSILAEVTGAGALPSELARGRRAFQHHVWAFEPLALTALIAQRNGVSLTDVNDRALERVARFIISSARSDTRIAELAKADQDSGIGGWPRPFETGALEIFSAVARLPEVEDILRNRRPASSPFSGGEWTRLLPRSPRPD